MIGKQPITESARRTYPVPMCVVTARSFCKPVRARSGMSLPQTASIDGSANQRTVLATVSRRNRLSASV